MELRPHQSQAVDEIMASVAFGTTKLIADLPTSFGKSFVLSTLAERLAGKVVIIVTFTALIEQIAEHLDEVGLDYSILKAGMDDKFDASKRIQLVMAQTLHARQDKLDMKADFLLKDEVHVEWLGQKRMDSIYSSLGAPVIIGVSGTPFDSKGYLLKGTDDIVRTKSVKDLTNDGFLTPVKYFVPRWAEDVNYDNLSIKGNDYTESDIDSIVLEDNYMEPAIKSMLHMGIDKKKSIVFCNSIEHCNLVAANLNKKKVKAYPFHSKIDKLRSDSILRSFKDNCKVSMNNGLIGINEEVDCQVLCAVNKVSIGFDVPDIELGVMMRKMAVRSLFYQQIGRLIRTHEGKEYAELLDIANNTATFGFHDEVFSPVRHGEKSQLDKENERLAARETQLVVGEEPTEVTRGLVLAKVEELRKKAKKIPELDFKDLLAIYETSNDPRQIIQIGYDINRRKTSTSYQATQVDWASEPWTPFMEKFPQYKSRILRTLRTRVKNIVSGGKKMASIYYFVEWLSDQSPYVDYTEQDSVDVSEEVQDNYINISDDDIPF